MANLTEIVRSTLDPLMKGLEQRFENLEESKKNSSKESNANQEETERKEPNDGVLQLLKEKTENTLKGKEI